MTVQTANESATNSAGTGYTGAHRPEAMHPKVAAAVDSWKRSLLDLTKRNRALAFKPTKVSTLAIVAPTHGEIFRALHVDRKHARFRVLPDDGVKADPGSGPLSHVGDPGVEQDDETEGEWPAHDELAPHLVSSETDDQGERWIQTTLQRDALERSLRRIEERARLTIDEQGVNTLFLALGMLHYIESSDSEQQLRAPLILLPVALERKSARAGYTLCATDEDPLVNTALSEQLRLSFGIELPDLPDSESMSDDYDLAEWFSAAAAAIQRRSGWSLTQDVFLGHFWFQKLVMYKDLEANAAALAAHRLICVVTGATAAVDQSGGMPSEIREMDLDRDYVPETTNQVVDADSSQLRAIAAVARNHDLVLEGPPGTGKSQTITNMIAQALGAGKSVLFVAEKMAALQVVYGRLTEAGLGEFCLELHSTKANKLAVMRELGRSLDASVLPPAVGRAAADRIASVRSNLTEYVRALHEPHGRLAISPFAGLGAFEQVYGEARLSYEGPVDTLTKTDPDQTVRELQDLARAAEGMGVIADHPWRDATKPLFLEADLEHIKRCCEELGVFLGSLRAQRDAAAAFGISSLDSLTTLGSVAAIADVIGRSPGASRAVLSSDAWNAPPPEATALVARGRSFAQLRDRIRRTFTDAVFERKHGPDTEYIERRLHGLAAFLALFDGRYREIKRRWLATRGPSYKGSLGDQCAQLRLVDRLNDERCGLGSVAPTGRAMFGALWRGEDSDWDALDRYLVWVTDFRATYRRYGLTPQAIEVATKVSPDVAGLRELDTTAKKSVALLERLRGALGWPSGYLCDDPLSAVQARITSLKNRVNEGPRWAAFENTRAAVAGGAARCLLPIATTGEVPFRALPGAFLRAFYSQWISGVVTARPSLARFASMSHDERVAEFRSLDKRVLVENRSALVRKLRDQVQLKIRDPDAADGMQFLRKQLARQRGLAPLRRTMQMAAPAVRAIKPCLLMSPLTVAQYLGGEVGTFDLVIFDEASQLPPEDAAGAILRGRQLVVVGDPKQLPPTTFFAVLGDQGVAGVSDDGTPLYEDSESILEEYLGAGVSSTRLRWHYRSAHESLIQFSNRNFYDGDLYTFPSVERSTDTYGLQFEFVPEGVYEGKGLNAAEARRVADAVVTFAKEQEVRRTAGETPWSLGVGTFNMRQQLAIQDELEQRRRADPNLEPFFAPQAEPFFVKNLENIQGDERDVIFLSVTYAKAPDGKLRQNFGPLNGENGWRRLNVLVSRARRRMRVFSSMHGDEISVGPTGSYGARLLREFLLYAERGILESVAASVSADAESPFEQEVGAELLRRGLTVVPQVGVAGYRIDLGVVDDTRPGRYLCGIECDGVAYHSSECARDRDRLRQEVLEKRGWTIIRVWSTDWFKDRSGAIDRLLRLISQCRERSAAVPGPPPEAPSTAMSPPPVGPTVGACEAAPTSGGPGESTTPGYTRPKAAAYVTAGGAGRFGGQDITTAPLQLLTQAIAYVVRVESPVHYEDLMARIVGMWGTKAGSRIAANVGRVIRQTERAGLIRRRGNYFWTTDDTCAVRSRAETDISGDRIAPEEYEAAVRQVLGQGHAFPRHDLTAEVRSVFGFDRTGSRLDSAIGAVLDDMLARGVLGETSSGIVLRQ